jgi:hypothetical protein
VADLEEQIQQHRSSVAREVKTELVSLSEGAAVGRKVRVLDLQGAASAEEYEVLSWCDRNGFYKLSDGEAYYPCQLRLT